MEPKASGLYLIVWENLKILHGTKGGYPHITVVHSGQHLAASKLAIMGFAAFKGMIDRNECKFVLPRKNAYVNSFFETKTQKQRYDVLLGLDDSGVQRIQKIRETMQLIRQEYSTQPPRVTHSIHYDEESAKAALAQLPEDGIEVHVTGFTID